MGVTPPVRSAGRVTKELHADQDCPPDFYFGCWKAELEPKQRMLRQRSGNLKEKAELSVGTVKGVAPN